MKASRIRLSSIDALRGLAVILMFFHHFPEFLMQDPYNSDTFILMFMISRLSAPLFLAVVGISIVLSAYKRSGGEDKNATVRHFIKRGFTLLIAGAVLNVMIFADPMKLNILHTIGLSIIILSIVAVSPTMYNIAASLLAALLCSEAAYFLEPAKTILSRFDFPLFPWIIFVIYGMILGSSIIQFNKEGKVKIIVWYLQVSAVLLMVSTAFCIFIGIPFEYQHKITLPFISLAMALTAYILSISLLVYEIRRSDPAILRPLLTYGRFALPVYFIHYAFVITIPRIQGFENMLSLNESLYALVVFLIASYLVLRKIERSRRPFP